MRYWQGREKKENKKLEKKRNNGKGKSDKDKITFKKIMGQENEIPKKGK